MKTRRAWWFPTTITARLMRGHFTGLTIAVLILMFCANVIVRTDLREVVAGLGFSVLLLFAIWTVGPRLRVAMVALAVPTFIGHWTLQVSNLLLVRSVGFALVVAFLAFLTLVIILAVFQHEAVTADTIVGAVCAYLLLGVTWGAAYALVALVSPDAFAVSSALATAAGWAPPTAPFTPMLQYYSFTTLTSLGYGDVSPLTAGARMLSVLEGLTGQLYLAVLIARLVGLHTARLRD